MARHWFKGSVLYSLDVRSFRDSDGDGTGDLNGVVEQLGYLQTLGVDCLWILPFFPSKNRDFGYDITDHCAVDHHLGNVDGFKNLREQAGARGMKLIIDLVVNHTSDQHPWFQEAKKGKGSPYYNYYVWADKKPENDSQHVVFKNVEHSNWAFCEETGTYYYHTFYSFQPDLNLTNPAVQQEVLRIIDFWMGLGIDGFRVDAVPHLLREKGSCQFDGDPFDLLRQWKKRACQHNPEAVLTGESDVKPGDYAKYISGDRMDGLFNFYCNNYFFYALAIHDPAPLATAFEQMEPTGDSRFYINFLRNHDELDLERLTKEERKKVFQAFAPEADMRVYNRGIRRRLAPMLNNDQAWIELCFSLLFSLPGTPIIRYGEEIGMGDELKLTERNSVRTAMQWNGNVHGGFTVSGASKQVWPVVSGGANGYEQTNVEKQLNDTGSLLSVVIKLVKARKRAMPFSYGQFRQLPVSEKGVLAHFCIYENKLALAVHNFSDTDKRFEIDIAPLEQRKLRLLTGTGEQGIGGAKAHIYLPRFGYAWWLSDE